MKKFNQTIGYGSLALTLLFTACASAPSQEKSSQSFTRIKKHSGKPYQKWDQNIEPNVVDDHKYPEKYTGPALRVWFDKGHINAGMAQLTQRFKKEKGVEVIVTPSMAPVDDYLPTPKGERPDIICGSHDRLPVLADTGIIQPIHPSRSTFKENVLTGWLGMSDHDEIFGYPIASTAISLIYNPDLLSTPPATFEEIPALQKKLQLEKKIDALRFDYKNSYFSWPLISASNDGEVYIYGKDAQGEYDHKSVGINAPAAAKGLTLLKSLVTQGVLPTGDAASYGAMEKAFNKEQLAMMINGPWAIDNLIHNGISFKLAPIPKANGATPKPFVGVYGCMLSKDSKTEIATDFLENFLLTTASLAAIDPNNSFGVSTHKEYFKLSYEKPYFQEMAKLTSLADPMPDTDYMGLFWRNMGITVLKATTGDYEPQMLLDLARIKMMR